MGQLRHLAGGHAVLVGVAEMATHVIDHVGDLGIAQMCRRAVPHPVRRCTERRHAVAPAEHDERHVPPGGQREIAGQFRIVACADGPFAVRAGEGIECGFELRTALSNCECDVAVLMHHQVVPDLELG